MSEIESIKFVQEFLARLFPELVQPKELLEPREWTVEEILQREG